MGSFPKTDALAAAWHTRPSVVSPQSADAAALARLQSCAICLANITVLFEPLFNRLFRSIGDITCASVLNLLNDWAGGLYLFAAPRNHSDQETCHDHVPEFHKLLHGASIFSGRSP